ncbi:hypothetical protein [Thalassoroseus pseudoceratinae]|uniref:hypothetical protein n=1 Tax=Thalassoroseus pseudoceratinae TaxID=2713176 RepID=UPI00141E3868|nr:hypothetical protein [Thalassoroseus pseudoceratinae]
MRDGFTDGDVELRDAEIVRRIVAVAEGNKLAFGEDKRLPRIQTVGRVSFTPFAARKLCGQLA